MSANDITGLVLSYVYAFGLLGLIEFIGKKAGWPQWVTRKLVHIGAGMWVWGIVYIFDSYQWGIVPFATFIILNFIFYKYQIFKTMDEEDSSPGTVYFAISITVLFLLFWRKGLPGDHVIVAVAPVMVMTWGDAFASLIGKGLGRLTYTVFGHTRTWKGSLAMFIVSGLAVFFSIQIITGSAYPYSMDIPLHTAALAAFITALAASIAEGLSPAGTDNLSVPLISALVLWLIL